MESDRHYTGEGASILHSVGGTRRLTRDTHGLLAQPPYGPPPRTYPTMRLSLILSHISIGEVVPPFIGWACEGGHVDHYDRLPLMWF